MTDNTDNATVMCYASGQLKYNLFCELFIKTRFKKKKIMNERFSISESLKTKNLFKKINKYQGVV